MTHLILAAIGLAVVWGVLSAIGRFIDEHGLTVLAWRFATGQLLTGPHECPADRGERKCRRGPWAHARRHRRASLRAALTIPPVFIAWGMLAAPGLTLTLLSVTAALIIAGAVLWLRHTAAARRHDRTIVRPLAASLAMTLPVAELEARALVRLSARYQSITRGEVGRVMLPDWYPATPDQRKAVDHLLTTHLAAEVETTWQVTARPKRVLIAAAPSPPALVPWASVAELMLSLPSGDVLLGVDRRGDPYVGSFNGGDDPHWGFSVGSGRGKSSQLCSIGAQVVRQDPGASVLGVDPKMSSFDPLAGVPGVELANDPRDMPGMWAAIARYRAAMDDRITAKQADPTLEFPLSLLFIDELNQFSAMTAAAWKDAGEKGTAPVWMDIAAVLWMGRFVRCHGILVGQRLDEKATGGIGLRDSLGLRGLAGFRPNQWKMLVGTSPIPKSQKPRGRWIYTDGQDETWVQNVYGTPQELRAWAMAGRGPGAAGAAVRLSVPPLASTGGAIPDGHAPVAGVAWVTGLAAAAQYLEMSPAAFEKARQRRPVDGETRRGSQPAWSTGDLDEWRDAAPRAARESASA